MAVGVETHPGRFFLAVRDCGGEGREVPHNERRHKHLDGIRDVLQDFLWPSVLLAVEAFDSSVTSRETPMVDDYKILNWFLGCEPVVMALNWPVDPESLVASVTNIHRLAKSDSPDPAEIAEAWNLFGGAVGPILLGKITASNEWRHLVPNVSGHGHDWCNVWSDGTRRVGARVVYDGNLPINVRFGVEK
jgi:hypothetical protein